MKTQDQTLLEQAYKRIYESPTFDANYKNSILDLETYSGLLYRKNNGKLLGTWKASQHKFTIDPNYAAELDAENGEGFAKDWEHAQHQNIISLIKQGKWILVPQTV
jgi:hypothetical protein